MKTTLDLIVAILQPAINVINVLIVGGILATTALFLLGYGVNHDHDGHIYHKRIG